MTAPSPGGVQTVHRYALRLVTDESGIAPEIFYLVDPNGDWVRYGDIAGMEKELAAVVDQLAKLRAMHEQMCMHAVAFPAKPDWIGTHLQGWIASKDAKAESSAKIAHEAIDQKLAALSEAARLRKALERHGRHHEDCETMRYPTWTEGKCSGPCDCGLTEALRGAAGEARQ